ncbi:hypothetical protein PIB30_014121 [Stylosanthes scabra]|uniref:Uncharacterized protein n=1 Tax=Stylosanthes scabra TaxID=79078 RepID=A0ABU6T7E9_9FABA|nr:hypothetical protein [Stylosanthes scabra]
MILSRVDPVINVVGPFYGSREDLGRPSALGRRKGDLMWTWVRQAQHPEQLPPSSEGRRIRTLRVLSVPWPQEGEVSLLYLLFVFSYTSPLFFFLLSFLFSRSSSLIPAIASVPVRRGKGKSSLPAARGVTRPGYPIRAPSLIRHSLAWPGLVTSLPAASEITEIQGNDLGGEVHEVEGAQMPLELNPLYDYVNHDVLGSPCTMTEDYLTELKNSGVIFGGGEEEGHYRVELPHPGERVCELNLEHPRVPHWLWVNEVMFTEFGVRISFSHFQQRLLQRCFVALSQFHPNAWSAIRCFQLVTEFLELPQDPEVFLYLFTVFSLNADGNARKGYMPMRPGKNQKIFGLYEESFHDFKGRYFKVFTVGDHPPFWLTLKRDTGRFPSYWSKDAGVNYVPVAYKNLNEDQRDTADILLWLFSQRFLKPKAILGNPEWARRRTIGIVLVLVCFRFSVCLIILVI